MAKAKTEKERIEAGAKASWKRTRSGRYWAKWRDLGFYLTESLIADFEAGLVAGGFIKARRKVKR